MAFDYGTKRVGIAVTDENRIIATGLDTILSHELFPFIRKYLSEQDVDLFVVGYPRNLDYSRNEMTTTVETFISSLQNHFPKIDVIEIDERFTSKMAQDAILQSGAKKKKRQDKALIDKVSATIILQDYLNRI